jgi:sentrin-specific protease 1
MLERARDPAGYDCGVFTCMFADFLSKDCPLVFDQEHISQCRERIALAILKGQAIV